MACRVLFQAQQPKQDLHGLRVVAVQRRSSHGVLHLTYGWVHSGGCRHEPPLHTASQTTSGDAQQYECLVAAASKSQCDLKHH